MGRYSWSNRNTVEECEAISISWLRQHDYLCGFRSGVIEWRSAGGHKTSVGIEVSVDKINTYGSFLKINYDITKKTTGEIQNYNYKVEIVSTPCNYGGARYWFICPLTTDGRYCGRRIAKLHLAPGSNYFGCRHCHNLTYTSCKEHDKRVDALMKYPDLLNRFSSEGNVKDTLLVLKAQAKLLGM
ncbi:MAG: hypothetical protein J7K40_03505 [candidate division Zixibacteria bacterium]|nr:hypothetical protein [candidate division Zixibacteria bacterium]